MATHGPEVMTQGANPLYGAIEAGGTKIVCGIGSATAGSMEIVRVTTGEPGSTIRSIIHFFEGARGRYGPIDAVGIASFGPLDLDPSSPAYGSITTTPKPGWQRVNLRESIGTALGVKAGINTDVNAAALAEACYGAARGRNNVAYVTVGTGIGVGLLSGGHMVQGLGHPEAGHLRVTRHPLHARFAGICPFHGDCLEGLASGSAVKAAWGSTLDEIRADHPAWEVEAHYLGHLCAALILTAAPDHIVLGGGVMQQRKLLPAIRAKTLDILAGYPPTWTPAVADERITCPGSDEPPGLIGAYLIAEDASTR